MKMESEFQAGRMWTVGRGLGCGSLRAAGIGVGLGRQVRTEAAAVGLVGLAVSAGSWLKALARFLVDGTSVRNKWGFALCPKSVWLFRRL